MFTSMKNMTIMSSMHFFFYFPGKVTIVKANDLDIAFPLLFHLVWIIWIWTNLGSTIRLDEC